MLRFAGRHLGSARGLAKALPVLPSRPAVVRAGRKFVSQLGGTQPSVSDSKDSVASGPASSIVNYPSNVQPLPETHDVVKTWEIRLLYDGDCPLCMREVNMLKGKDAGEGKIDFVDISSPSYDPEDNQGITYAQAMNRIHGILPNGSVIENVEVFRRCYEAVGLGWVYAITKYEPIGRLADAVYNLWAKYRLPITGREPLEIVLEKRKNNFEGVTCDESDACEIPFPPKK